MFFRTSMAIHLSVLLMLLFICPVAAEESTIKIGFIDLKRVYEESGKQEEFEKKLKEIRREKDLILIEMKDKISAMEKMMLELSDEKRIEKERDLRQLQIELENFRKDAANDLNRKMAELEREFANELKEIVTKVGEEEGYTYILSDLVIMYSDPQYDLTEKVIKAFKEQPGVPSSKTE